MFCSIRLRSVVFAILLVVVGLSGSSPLYAQPSPSLPGLPYTEDFETDGEGTRYTTSNTFYDGSNDHFQRTNGGDISNVTGPYTGFRGTFFWAGEDLDDGGGDTQDFKTLTLQEVDVSGQSDVRFSGLFAAGCNEGEQFSCYDLSDSLVVRYSVDGGTTFQTALQFSYVERFTDSGSLDGFNEPFARDFDFDGDGEGIELTPAMQRFGFEIPSPASTVIVQLEAHIDGAAEEFAFDDLRIESRPSTVTVVDPLPDLTVAATRSDVVDLRTTFAESQDRGLSFSAVSSNPSIATVSASNDLDELLIQGVAEGTATIDVVATAPNGDEAVDTFVVTVGSAPPSFEMDTRIAFADDFCSDVNDPNTCNVIGAYRFSQVRSDTLSRVNPGEKVLVRYILRNFGPGDLTDLEIVDEDRGTIVSGVGPVPRFDSLVVNRIYDAPQATGLDISQVEGAATTTQGTRGTRRDIYGIDVPAPEVRLNTRIARARDFCSDVTDPSTCGVIGAYRFGSPRSDTLSNVNPSEKVLVRYIATNLGSTDITRFTLTDDTRGVVFDGAEVAAPFDSLVVNRIYDAPLPTGLEVTRVDVTAEDAGGNADTDATLYGIDRPGPEVRLNTRIARAADFCSNVNDPSTCSVVGAWSGTGPRSDTLSNINPGEKVLVRYIATNRGSTDLTRFTLTDDTRGVVFDGAEVAAPFDSLVVNRIYDAPLPTGLEVTRVDVTAEDAGGNADTDATLYGIDVPGPEVRTNVRVARAADFCSNVNDPSTCNVVGEYRFSSPRSDTLRNTNPLERVLVRYVATNIGSTDITEVDLTDSERGAILTNELVNVAPFDSVVVNRIYDAPSVAGLQVARATTVGRDAGGNETTGAQLYGIDVPAPEVRLNTRIAFADDFCSDVTDPSTCNVVGAYRFGSPRSDTLANVDPGRKVLVRYIATNRGSTDITRFTLTDDTRGVVFDGAEVAAPFDSLVVNRIYDAPLPTGLEVTRVDVTAEDAGGNADTDATLYGIDRPAPEVRMNVRVARAADFCSNVNDPSTCNVVGAWSGTGPRSDTLASVNPGEKVLVRYIATNVGRTTLRSFEISDGNEGLIATAPSIDVTPFDSLVVNRIYDGPALAGVRTSFGRVEARDAGGNAATPKQDRYGVQGIGPAFRFVTRVAPASLFCSDPQDVSTCSTRRLKRALAKLQSDPDALQKMQRKLGSEREVVRYAFYNIGTLNFVRHTLDDNVAGTVFQDNAFTVAPLDSSIVYRIYSEVPGIGESRTATWRAVTSDGQVLTESSVEAPLPVELAAFGAQVADRRVTLEWTTASEENNAGFEVQQFDAEQDTWQVLSFVEGAGTSLETQAYRYDVGALDPDVHRFRLRQVDVSGRFAYSDAIEAVVGIDGPFRFVSPAPHPIRSAATADLTVREAQPVRVELFDLLGRRVSTVFDARMNANRPETIDIQTDGLASGMYFLRVQGETFRHVERISIVR